MSRPVVRRLAPAVALVLLAMVAPRARAAEEKVLRDLWTVVRIGGAKVGWEHVVVRRTADDPARISTTTENHMVLRRMGQDTETASVQTTVEAEDGTLLSVHAVEKQSAVEQTTDVTFEGGKAKVTTVAMGQKRETTIDVPADLVGPWRLDAVPREAQYPKGKTFDMKSFFRELGGPKTIHVTVTGPEEVVGTDGAKVTLTRLEQTIDGLPVKSSAWVDADGTPVRTLVVMMGMKIEAVRSTKAEATGESGAKELPPDLFDKTLIVVSALFPHARTADSARLRVRPAEPGGKVIDLADERQRFESVGKDGSVVLEMRRVVPPADHGAKRPLADPPAEVAPFLASSSTIQADDPLLAAKAKEAVGSETDAWKAAQAIEAWVYKNLAKKNMGVAFASALEVCKNLEGDCTEHSVLVAGLCRAAGIPARVVMGLECVQGIWGGHAWDEVWIAGSWYALDATLGFGSVDPLHLAVAKSALAEGSFGNDLVSGLMSVIGSVKISIEEVTKGGKTINPSEELTARVEGQRYRNRLFALSFEAPSGLGVEVVHPAGLETRLATVVRPGTPTAVVTVHAMDAPAGFGLDGRGAKVDGRASVTKEDGGKKRVIVLVDDTIFAFEAGSPADAKSLDDLLATVDFDAE